MVEKDKRVGRIGRSFDKSSGCSSLSFGIKSTSVAKYSDERWMTSCPYPECSVEMKGEKINYMRRCRLKDT